MKIRLYRGLPVVSAAILFHGQRATFNRVLIDTGSAGTLFQSESMLKIGMTLEPQDEYRHIRGVGGAEFVFVKTIDQLEVGALALKDFEIEVGALNYGLDVKGILGMDFLTKIGANVDLERLALTWKTGV